MKKNYSILAVLFVFLSISSAFAATTPTIVTADNNLTGWVLEDTLVPVIALEFAIPGGIVNDPDDKSGRASFHSYMLTQGAGDMDKNEFQQALDDASISLSFSAGRDYIFGSLKTLKSNKALAVKLLKTALSEPRFDDDAFAQAKEQRIASLKQSQKTPSWLLWRNFNDAYYQDHPYAKPGQGLVETVEKLTIEDMKTAHEFYKNNGVPIISIAGDINANDAKNMIDDIFGNQFKKNNTEKAKETESTESTESYAPITLPQEPIHIDLDVPQTVILMGRPSFDEKDPDWAAAQVANYLLGGGGFSSALMQDIRVEKGLSYGISSFISTQKQADLFMIQTSTATKTVEETRIAIRDVLNRTLQEGFDEVLIEDAKNYQIAAMPLQLTSTDSLASLYLNLQLKDQPTDYLKQRAENIRAVTKMDVRRALSRMVGDMGFVEIHVGQKPDISEQEK